MMHLSMVILALASPQTVNDEERCDGFVSMFNGRDFSGWQFGGNYGLPSPPPENWKVEDGVIKLSGGGKPHLGSQWDYEDFEMRFEWRAMRKKYNGGFYIRSRRKVGANQINLASGGEGRFFGGKMKGGRKVPELQKEAGEWNDWRVRVVGDKVTFRCNGKVAWEGVEFESKRGHIGLQAEGAPLEFRNFRIKEIGWDRLGDLSAGSVRSEKSYGDFVLRLEWKAEKGTTGHVGPRGVETGEGTLKLGGSGNPPGQWNYVEVRLADRRVKVWQNGKEIVKDQVLDVPATGPITLGRSADGFQVRNARVRARGNGF